MSTSRSNEQITTLNGRDRTEEGEVSKVGEKKSCIVRGGREAEAKVDTRGRVGKLLSCIV